MFNNFRMYELDTRHERSEFAADDAERDALLESYPHKDDTPKEYGMIVKWKRKEYRLSDLCAKLGVDVDAVLDDMDYCNCSPITSIRFLLKEAAGGV